VSTAQGIGTCNECKKPVLYGTPAYWTVCEHCDRELVYHQSCAEVVAERLRREAEEDGAPVARPVVN